MTIHRSTLVALACAPMLLFSARSADAQKQKKQRDVITREEIINSAHVDLDLYQVVRALRPHFLEPPKGVRSMGGNSFQAAVAVYVDGKRDTGADALRFMNAQTVAEVRYLEPTRSATEFGARVNGGALLIKLTKPATAADAVPPPPKDSLGTGA